MQNQIFYMIAGKIQCQNFENVTINTKFRNLANFLATKMVQYILEMAE